MPQDYDESVSVEATEALLQPLLAACAHAPLEGASVETCLLLQHVLSALEHGYAEHSLDVPAWLHPRYEAVTKALEARLMQELLAAEDELQMLEEATRDRARLRARIARLSDVLGLPDAAPQSARDEKESHA